MGYNFVLSLLDRPSVLKKNNRPLTGTRKVSNSFRSKEKKNIYIYLSTFLEMKKKGRQTASRGGEGRYISLEDKSAFHEAVWGEHKSSLSQEKM